MKLTPAIVRPTARTIINSSSENPRLFVDFIISFGEEETLYGTRPELPFATLTR
jgi:hypothetical protein